MTLNRRRFLTAAIACPLCASLARADELVHWTYEGHDGTAQWGKLDKKFEACVVGSEQSPLDLSTPIEAKIGGLDVNWVSEAFSVVNNGHTIQANVSSKSSLSFRGENYELKQFHFHTPSEHAIDGKRTEMEAHFVHANSSGKLLVLGVFMRAGRTHDDFTTIMATAPKTSGAKTLPTAIDPASFLPKDRTRYRYEGSLTTPPCTEVVDWHVFAQPIEVGAADIATFKALYPMNARPLQSAKRRFVLKGI
ncbi:carbonic anhydrase family protein [Burkholderia ubonensis]|uniref:carbonic anhydrase n=1 Tax=Burkholderia ubonensis TaxID=101571 RepID=UPI0009B464EA